MPEVRRTVQDGGETMAVVNEERAVMLAAYDQFDAAARNLVAALQAETRYVEWWLDRWWTACLPDRWTRWLYARRSR